MTESGFRKVAVDDLPDAPNPTRRKKEVDEAVGAPKASDGAVIEEPCPECGDETAREHEERDGGETYVLRCAECDAELTRMTAGPE